MPTPEISQINRECLNAGDYSPTPWKVLDTAGVCLASDLAAPVQQSRGNLLLAGAKLHGCLEYELVVALRLAPIAKDAYRLH